MSEDITIVRDGAARERRALTIAAAKDTPLHLCPSTLPTTKDGIRRRFNAMGQSSIDLDRDGTVAMYVQDVLAYWREGENPNTGEISEFSWLVLIDPTGATWGTSSNTVAEKIGQVVALWSADLLPRPLAVQIVTRTARRSGQRYHDIILLEE